MNYTGPVMEVSDLLQSLESLLLQGAEPTSQQLLQAHDEVGKFVRQVNKRLADVGRLLHDGRRSEAIDLAELDPNLFDQVNGLDSNVYREWLAYSQDFGLVLPPLINEAILEELYNAFGREQRIARLLDRHRLLALGRQPCSLRVPILRQLHQADPENPIWAEDLEKLERLYQAELDRAIDDAASINDVDRLGQIHVDLASNHWRSPPTPPLIAKATHTLLAVQKKILHLEALCMVQCVEGSLKRHDYEQLLPQLEFLENAYRNGVELDNETLARIEPAEAWYADHRENLKRQEKQESALEALELAIDSSQDPEKVKSLFQKWQALGGTHQGVDRTTHQYINSRTRRQKMQRWGLVSGVTIAGLALAIGGFWSVYQTKRAQRAKKHQEQLQFLLQAQDYRGAQAYFEQQIAHDSALVVLPSIIATKKTIDAELEAISEQEKEFEQALTKAQQAFDSLKASLQENNLSNTSLAINYVESSAKTPDQVKAATKLRTLWKAEEQEWQSQKLAEHRTKCNQALEQANLVDLEDPVAVNQAIALLQQLSESILTSPESKSILDSTAQHIREKRQSLRDLSDKEQRLRKLPNLIGDWDAFEKLLTTRGQDESQDRRLTDILQTWRRDKPLILALDSWNSFSNNWNSLGQETVDIQRASSFVQQARERNIPLAFQDLPVASSLARKIDILRPMAQRESQSMVEKVNRLRDYLSSDQISNLFSIVTKNRRYYFYNSLRGNPSKRTKNGDEFFRLTYLRNGDTFRKTTEVEIPIADVKNLLDNWEDPNSWLAPHAVFARELREDLGPLLNRRWNETFDKKIQRLLDQDTVGMEPFVRALLLHRTFEVALAGSWELQQRYEEHRKILSAFLAQPTTTSSQPDWLDISEQNKHPTLLMAARVMKDLAELPIPPLGKIVREQLANRECCVNFRIAGILLKDSEQNWKCDSNDKIPSGNLSLWIRYSNASGKAVTVRAGSTENGNITLTPNDAFQEGRILLIQTPLATHAN